MLEWLISLAIIGGWAWGCKKEHRTFARMVRRSWFRLGATRVHLRVISSGVPREQRRNAKLLTGRFGS